MNEEKRKDEAAHLFDYTVDDEAQTTSEHILTPSEILTKAGLNPATYYLEEIIGHEKKSFKDKLDEQIHMHEHMKFVSIFIGDTPVSELS